MNGIKDKLVVGIGIYGCECLLFFEKNYECIFKLFLLIENRTENLIEKKIHSSNSDLLNNNLILNISNEILFENSPSLKPFLKYSHKNLETIILLNFSESFSDNLLTKLFKEINSKFQNIKVFVLLPFEFEGDYKKEKSLAQIEKFKNLGLKIEILDDDIIKSKYSKKTTLSEAYRNSFEFIADKISLKKRIKEQGKNLSSMKIWFYEVSKIAVGTFLGFSFTVLTILILVYFLFYYYGGNTVID